MSDERSWLVGLHLSALAGFVVPFGNIAGPLIIWLIKRPESPRIDTEGKQALNFQLSMTIYAMVSVFAMLILIGFLTIFLVFVVWIYGVISTAIRAGNGEPCNYPLSLPFFK